MKQTHAKSPIHERAARWLHLATEADMAGEGAEAEAARAAVDEMMEELFVHAERVRWPWSAASCCDETAPSPTTAAAEAGDERQKLFLGTLELTGELKPNGDPQRRAVAGCEPLGDGREAGALCSEEELILM